MAAVWTVGDQVLELSCRGVRRGRIQPALGTWGAGPRQRRDRPHQLEGQPQALQPKAVLWTLEPELGSRSLCNGGVPKLSGHSLLTCIQGP